jgi:transposase
LLAKTDKIDCKLLADYASNFAIQPQVNFKSQSQEQLTSLIKRRDQLMVMENQEHCRLETEKDNVAIISIRGHINYLQQEIKVIEQRINDLCKQDIEIQSKITQLTSIPGVGKTLAITAICYAPELGNIPISKLTSLIGIAPFARESGSYKGRRSIFGGRAYLRKILYMASVASLRVNKKLKAFYDRLIATINLLK